MRATAMRLTTIALACFASYLAVVLVLATLDEVGNILEGDGYGKAAFLLLLALMVFAGAAVVTWFARRDGHSWWRAARRACLVLIAGTYAVAMIHLFLSGLF